jgi:phenylpyruvate tautomerase PptA (4-oxalocrotonate tautomerase family)
MPIVSIEIFGDAEASPHGLAAALAEQLGAVPGSLWVRLRRTPAADYAENGPEPAPLPVFVRVLARGTDAETAAPRIACAVASAVGRPRERVHVIFEPDARGRVFFGGEPDRR